MKNRNIPIHCSSRISVLFSFTLLKLGVRVYMESYPRDFNIKLENKNMSCIMTHVVCGL